ncbi:hypothetical protein RHSIM_Rhsim12G0207000 [Rhododendron simsii]|uniref:Uncharacterized protein n=1 Tax=Rhododendron simsii TaxID=118357 RepID=A0A834L780_RHOSS|nr:hypothetical protein RHSIM_Rhsim12G0207000 [Rhododendron simsii]
MGDQEQWGVIEAMNYRLESSVPVEVLFGKRQILPYIVGDSGSVSGLWDYNDFLRFAVLLLLHIQTDFWDLWNDYLLLIDAPKTPLFILADSRLALGLAESVSQPAQIAAPTNKLYKMAQSCGLSDMDFSAVTEALKPQQNLPQPLPNNALYWVFPPEWFDVEPLLYLRFYGIHGSDGLCDVAFAMLADPESAGNSSDVGEHRGDEGGVNPMEEMASHVPVERRVFDFSWGVGGGKHEGKSGET